MPMWRYPRAVLLLSVALNLDRTMVPPCFGLTQPPVQPKHLPLVGATRSPRLDSRLVDGASVSYEPSTRKQRKCQKCPETQREDPELDRREAAFAMVGSLWAMAGGSAVWWQQPEPALAVYGADAKIELPNPIETMTQRTNGQCLVETLGSRECLVYLDPANKLYQGADNKVLLDRIDQASVALASIPDLVAARKWSQVSGVLTGPLGTLVVTMNQIAKLSENQSKVSDLAKKVKSDIIAIGAAADRKQGDAALKSHKDATENLVSFVKSL